MNIQKIRVNGDGITIIYFENQPTEEETKETKLTSKKAALPEFYTAFKALLVDVIELVGLDSDIWCNGDVLSIVFKEESRGVGATITATCTVGKSTSVVNTPYIAPDMDSSTQERLVMVLAHSIAYIQGQRQVKQLSLLGSNNE